MSKDDNVSSDSDDNNRGRPRKSVKYIKQRNRILEKMNDILGIDDENNFFFICDLTDEKIEEIESMRDDILRFFVVSSTRIRNNTLSRPYLAYIRVVYSEMNMKLFHVNKLITRKSKKIRANGYHVTKSAD